MQLDSTTADLLWTYYSILGLLT